MKTTLWKYCMKRLNKILISGGGTGGHIFPALSIAREVVRRYPGAEVLFVGALDRMEMQKIPAAGFEIEGLWISGINRKRVLSNLLFPAKLISSLWKARRIIKRFNPAVVVGTGGFASGPTLYMASLMGIPTLIQEQNSYPGITNKLLSRRAARICVAYEGLGRFFPPEKIVLTGNPVRTDLLNLPSRVEALRHFAFPGTGKTLLILGGSLGAAAINRTVADQLDDILSLGVQVLWQTGKLYYERYKQFDSARVKVKPFIERMDAAYASADVIVSRAGAGTISELALAGKPVLFIPSPNVAEDHQRKNAESLVEKNAAGMLTENELDGFAGKLAELFDDEDKRRTWSKNISAFAKPDATRDIVNEIEKLTGK